MTQDSKQSEQHSIYVQKLYAALDLMEFGRALMRQNIARRNPLASDDFLQAEFNRWLMEQPYSFFKNYKDNSKNSNSD